MDIGFTGTRRGMTSYQKEMLRHILLVLRGETFSHGDCVGSDKEAHTIAKIAGMRTVSYPPKDSKLRAFCSADEIKEPEEYLKRNKNIVNRTDILIATPGERKEVLRSGTWSTIRYADKLKKRIIIIFPKDHLEELNSDSED